MQGFFKSQISTAVFTLLSSTASCSYSATVGLVPVDSHNWSMFQL